MKVGVLGGGLAGLTVAAHLRHECEVLEQQSRCGGHCQTVEEEGFTFDAAGPHIIFSRNQPILDYMVSLLGDNVHQGRRNNKILYKGRYVKYPFENGLYDLDPEDRFECLYHYIKNDAPPPTNFKEWLYHTFGKGLTEKYLLPYNEKIWNVPAEELGLDWVEGRVPKPPLEDVIKAAVGVPTEGYPHQLHFYYPRTGGIESLTRAMQRKVTRITTGFGVQRIAHKRGAWAVSNGAEERQYDRIVATIPIQDLVLIVEGVPAEVIAAAEALRYNSLINVAIGVRGDALPDYTAVYIPDPTVKFHRIAFPAAFSRANVPAGKGLVVAEITANRGDGTWEMSDAALIDEVTADLERLGIIRRADICYTRLVRDTYGYVVQDPSYRRHQKVARSYFEGRGIHLCGRVAEHEYINMDVCIQRGIEQARALDGAA